MTKTRPSPRKWWQCKTFVMVIPPDPESTSIGMAYCERVHHHIGRHRARNNIGQKFYG